MISSLQEEITFETINDQTSVVSGYCRPVAMKINLRGNHNITFKNNNATMMLPKNILQIPKWWPEAVYILNKDRQYNGQTKNDKRTNNDVQNTTQKTRATRTPLKAGCELGWSGRVISSCSICGTRRVTLVINNQSIIQAVKHFLYMLLKYIYFAFFVISEFHVECLKPCLQTKQPNCLMCRRIFYISVPEPELSY